LGRPLPERGNHRTEPKFRRQAGRLHPDYGRQVPTAAAFIGGIRITWQTGAASEHQVRRSVQGYNQYAETARLERRIRELNATDLMDRESRRG
jgi:hypothetical protein